VETIAIHDLIIILPGLFCIAFIFSIFGRGGGEFILPFLITILALPYFDLASLSLFLIFIQGAVMLVVYGAKHKLVDWPLGLALAAIVGFSAFFGGYFSLNVKPIYLKGTFAVFLLGSAYFIGKGKKVAANKGRFGMWHRRMPEEEYDMNFLYIFVPVGIIAFVAGMLGISGCGLIIPLCILVGGVPIRVAMGTNTMLVLTSSGTSFMGHVVRGSFPWEFALIFAGATVIGSLLGSRMHVTISEKYIRIGFTAILVIAAVWMVTKIYIS
jgi:uncharacterized membrane protein YfcA